MKISIPKEIKDNEFRVAITPGAVNTLTLAGHEVYIEKKVPAYLQVSPMKNTNLKVLRS